MILREPLSGCTNSSIRSGRRRWREPEAARQPKAARPEGLIDASDACGRFIEQLAALVEAMKATLPNKGGA